MDANTSIKLKCAESQYARVSKKVIVAVLFLWLGLILGISFLEAPLKFQAPGITLELGLGIGRLVFGALNKIEVLLAVIALIPSIYLFKANRLESIFVYIIFGILSVQTMYLLPQLDIRAEYVINHQYLPPSNFHFFYVGFEFLKLFLLVTSGVLFLKSYGNEK